MRSAQTNGVAGSRVVPMTTIGGAPVATARGIGSAATGQWVHCSPVQPMIGAEQRGHVGEGGGSGLHLLGRGRSADVEAVDGGVRLPQVVPGAVGMPAGEHVRDLEQQTRVALLGLAEPRR